jgi:4-amino-4-deoxychorismate lyase
VQTRIPTWVNGKATGNISPANRALHYGDGLFETILCLQGQTVLKRAHLQRIEKGCHLLDINLDMALLEQELDLFLNRIQEERGLIKIIVSRTASDRGYSFNKESGCERILQFYPEIHYPERFLSGIKLKLSPCRLSSNDQLAGIKHLNRLEQVLASRQLNNQFYQEMIFLDSYHYVTEGLFSNLFLVKNNLLITPQLEHCGVEGVMRNFILCQVAPSLGVKVREKKLLLNEFLAADEIFTCNSVYGIWPVTQIETKCYKVGPLSRRIQSEVNSQLGYNQVYKHAGH